MVVMTVFVAIRMNMIVAIVMAMMHNDDHHDCFGLGDDGDNDDCDDGDVYHDLKHFLL